MNMRFSCRRPLSIALILGTVAGCGPTIESHGNSPQPERLAQVTPGRTKSDVLALLGTPSTTTVLGGESWFYISTKIQNYAVFPTEEVDRQVIEIDFDSSGTVSRIKKLGLSDGRDVAMVSRTTPTPGQEMNLLQQLLGNIGRFSTTDNKP